MQIFRVPGWPVAGVSKARVRVFRAVGRYRERFLQEDLKAALRRKFQNCPSRETVFDREFEVWLRALAGPIALRPRRPAFASAGRRGRENEGKLQLRESCGFLRPERRLSGSLGRVAGCLCPPARPQTPGRLPRRDEQSIHQPNQGATSSEPSQPAHIDQEWVRGYVPE